MSLKLQLPKLTDLRPRISVVGVGGAGGNAVNNMIASGLSGVEFVVANTDAQSLANSSTEHRLQLGAALTEGLGAGAKPEIGEAAAEEAIEDIRAQLAGAHMVFIAAGMGGGTGTGAASVIARVAKEAGALTVGVVTKPFQFEGTRRMRMAEIGIAAMRPHVDTLIVIPNQNLFRIATEKTTFADAFVLADQVLYSGVACVVDLIVKEGLINLDFADVRTVMSGMGTAMMGTGEASGERRAVLAAEEAISNPLLDDISLRGARGLLLSVTGGRDITLYEVDEAATRVRQEVDPEANIIVGATFDDTLGDRIRVSIVASGMERMSAAHPRPVPAPRAATQPPSAGAGPVARAVGEAMPVAPAHLQRPDSAHAVSAARCSRSHCPIVRRRTRPQQRRPLSPRIRWVVRSTRRSASPPPIRVGRAGRATKAGPARKAHSSNPRCPVSRSACRSTALPARRADRGGRIFAGAAGRSEVLAASPAGHRRLSGDRTARVPRQGRALWRPADDAAARLRSAAAGCGAPQARSAGATDRHPPTRTRAIRPHSGIIHRLSGRTRQRQ